MGTSRQTVSSILIKEDKVYVGTFGNGIYMGTITDNTLDQFNEDLSNSSINSLALFSDNLIAGTVNGLFRFSENGEYERIESEDINCVSSTFGFDNIALVGTIFKGLYFSTDYGDNWDSNQRFVNTKIISSLVVSNNNIIIGTINSGIYQYPIMENRIRLDIENRYLTNECVTSLSIKNYFLIVGTLSNGVWIKNLISPGLDFENSFQSVHNVRVFNIFQYGESIYVCTNLGIYFSNNGGDSWDSIYNYSTYSFCVQGEFKFASTSNGLLRKSNIQDWHEIYLS